ncbi:bifunctional tRNA (mnm(5)s(2)U34)-methyltransferase/FAD-dependent cmnm(5)s(2)U34 oxidoreductase [Posidoniimonas corsicana]|uniref:Bifunctional tRNA (Mnm(5)s(2)U34)-methyltransferase/FAD-dependent cmnm(5)s(2)U34 oxidoreductase n=1 Tax=Posidoniimonas corsicana TaxID=1938618 RepID=A0A5C5VH79_9BACT|nr:FAD-dependent oxidoreductase [Posidoniimonas corsicana]TWT37022.1 bifunctional tRNA (mnm(5)s(2)U34)-methyltransferase/FAD-dependent cmnm(5)s(2)U34 oxidoreductase [Posidoniimonas corsicana]
MAQPDTLVVGQGLAGTTLAWSLLLRGGRPLVMDAAARPAASRAAAGLLAPVGGKRLALAWRAEQAWPAAVRFYREVEDRLGVELLSEAPIVRLFVDPQQRAEFDRRASGPLGQWLVAEDAGVDPRVFFAPLGGCQVVGGRLDVGRFLDASRAEFARRGLLVEEDLPADGLRETEHGVAVDSLGSVLPRVVLCRGLAERDGRPLPFEPAKGETLTIRAPGVSEGRVVQRGVWLAPIGNALFRVGATFHPGAADVLPTVAGRRELESKLGELLRLPYEVVDHSAAVRPIVRTRRPIAGALPGRDRVGVLNGLGASGTLWAPWLAGHYADHLLSGEPLDREIDAGVRLAPG